MKKKQILLLQPWVEDFYATDCRMFPYGLACLAGSLKRRLPGVDVHIYDTFSGGRKTTLPWPKEFDYLKPYYGFPDAGPFSLFHQYCRFGRSKTEILSVLRKFTPILVGISSLFTPYYRQSLALARLCRKTFGETPIVMGGSHATMHPDSLLYPGQPFSREENLCDFVLRGECEDSICELVEYLMDRKSREEVTNLIAREGQSGCGTAHLFYNSRIPPTVPKNRWGAPPDFTGLSKANYLFNGRPMRFLNTSRSCPWSCSFCSVNAVFGKQYVKRDRESILREIASGIHSGVRHFDIEDDNFTHDRSHCLGVLEDIRALDVRISLSAMNGLNYQDLDAEILEALKASGFDSLNLSLICAELDNQSFGRPHSLEKFLALLQMAKDLNLRVIAYVILGLPGQEPGSMWSTLKILASSQCLIGPSPLYFTPGTALHIREKSRPDLRLASEGKDSFFSARLTAMDYEDSRVRREDIFTCFRLSRVLNHVKRGLDEGLSRDNAWFNKAREVLRTGYWCAETGKGAFPLPFSKRIHRLIREEGVEVRGYHTNNAIRMN